MLRKLSAVDGGEKRWVVDGGEYGHVSVPQSWMEEGHVHSDREEDVSGKAVRKWVVGGPELLALAQVVQALQEKHQAKEESHAKQEASADGEATPGVADAAAVGAQTSEQPTGEATATGVAETSREKEGAEERETGRSNDGERGAE